MVYIFAPFSSCFNLIYIKPGLKIYKNEESPVKFQYAGDKEGLVGTLPDPICNRSGYCPSEKGLGIDYYIK